MSRERDSRTYREQVEAGTPSVDRTARRAVSRGRAARCDVCGRVVQWREREYGGEPTRLLSTHTARLGNGRTDAGHCPGSGLPVVVDVYLGATG